MSLIFYLCELHRLNNFINLTTHSGSSPWRAASQIRAAVLRVWVLIMIFWRWISAVRWLVKSFTTISALVKSYATKLSTSISRLLRPRAVRAALVVAGLSA